MLLDKILDIMDMNDKVYIWDFTNNPGQMIYRGHIANIPRHIYENKIIVVKKFLHNANGFVISVVEVE